MKQKQEKSFNLFIKFVCLMLIVNLPFSLVKASELNEPLSSSDKAAFKEMFKPLFTLYNMFKFLATIIAAVYLSWGAINLMISGDDLKKREMAKAKLSFTVLGLMIVWGIPYFLEVAFQM